MKWQQIFLKNLQLKNEGHDQTRVFSFMAISWFDLKSIFQIGKPQPQMIRNDFPSVTKLHESRGLCLCMLTANRAKTTNEGWTSHHFHTFSLIKCQLPTAAATTFFSPKFSSCWTTGPHKLHKVQLCSEGKWLPFPSPSVNRTGRLFPY